MIVMTTSMIRIEKVSIKNVTDFRFLNFEPEFVASLPLMVKCQMSTTSRPCSQITTGLFDTAFFITIYLYFRDREMLLLVV
jgi:hypothetical protein